MSGYTKGPWHQGGYEVEADDGALICRMSGWINPSTTKANARLIATAPDLLEALKLADAALSGSNMNMKAVEKKVRAAIAKAEPANV